MRYGIAGSLTALMLLLLCTGCATLPRQAQLPLGEWSGHGLFVIDKWAPDGKPAADWKPVVEWGRYATALTIEKAQVEGADAVRIEILSQRGATKAIEGDRTHIIALLQPQESLADGAITLYRVAEFGASTTAEAPHMEKGPEERRGASCMCVGRDLVLCFNYMDEFEDTFRFRGDTVLKDGSYFDSKSGLVHWSEKLDRKR